MHMEQFDDVVLMAALPGKHSASWTYQRQNANQPDQAGQDREDTRDHQWPDQGRLGAKVSSDDRSSNPEDQGQREKAEYRPAHHQQSSSDATRYRKVAACAAHGHFLQYR